MGRRALLVIDMLNDFVLEGAPLEVPSARGIIPAVKAAIERAREEGIPVIYVCDSHDESDPEFDRMGWPPHALAGSEGAQVIEELRPFPEDQLITKKGYSGFFRTSLEEVLKNGGISELVVMGCVTNICVLYTVADAVQRGYMVKVLKDCVAGLNPRDHKFGLKQMEEVLRAQVV
jgi:nicotinamidase-related amidase